MGKFVLKAPYVARGDQPQAIEALAKGIKDGLTGQTLLGVTGSGKTFTMASVIERIQRPTLVIAHNKTLAAQLCSEFKAFFPTVRLSILSATTIITNPKPILRRAIHTSKRMRRSMMRLTACVTVRQRRCASAAM